MKRRESVHFGAFDAVCLIFFWRGRYHRPGIFIGGNRPSPPRDRWLYSGSATLATLQHAGRLATVQSVSNHGSLIGR